MTGAESSEQVQQEGETIEHLHVHEDPWCEWCDEEFEDGDSIQAIQWDLGGSTMIATFCSEDCADEWANAVEMQSLKVGKVHV